jgi:hypothetical protein
MSTPHHPILKYAKPPVSVYEIGPESIVVRYKGDSWDASRVNNNTTRAMVFDTQSNK